MNILFEIKKKGALRLHFRGSGRIVTAKGLEIKTLTDEEKILECPPDKTIFISTNRSGRISITAFDAFQLNREKAKLRFLLFVKRAYIKAMHNAKKLNKIFPNDSEIAGHLALSYVHLHKYTEASLIIEDYGEDEPGLVFAKAFLAKFNNCFKREIVLLKKALKMIDQRKVHSPLDYIFKLEIYKELLHCCFDIENLSLFFSFVDEIKNVNIKNLELDRIIIQSMRNIINTILTDRIKTLQDVDSLQSLAYELEQAGCYSEADIIRESIIKLNQVNKKAR